MTATASAKAQPSRFWSTTSLPPPRDFLKQFATRSRLKKPLTSARTVRPPLGLTKAHFHLPAASSTSTWISAPDSSVSEARAKNTWSSLYLHHPRGCPRSLAFGDRGQHRTKKESSTRICPSRHSPFKRPAAGKRSITSQPHPAPRPEPLPAPAARENRRAPARAPRVPRA